MREFEPHEKAPIVFMSKTTHCLGLVRCKNDFNSDLQKQVCVLVSQSK